MSRPWCLYYVQEEEGDNAEEPNAFPVMGSGSNVTLKQLLASFPLEKGGVYHFRFRSKDDRFGYGWQDVKDPNASIPVAPNGVIYAKILRLDQTPRPITRLRRKPMLAATSDSSSSSSASTSSYANRPPPTRQSSASSNTPIGRRGSFGSSSQQQHLQSPPSPSMMNSGQGGRRNSNGAGTPPMSRNSPHMSSSLSDRSVPSHPSSPSVSGEPTINRVGTSTGIPRPSSAGSNGSSSNNSNSRDGNGSGNFLDTSSSVNRAGSSGGSIPTATASSPSPSTSTTVPSTSSNKPATDDLDSFLYGGGGRPSNGGGNGGGTNRGGNGVPPTKPGSRPGSSLGQQQQAAAGTNNANGLFNLHQDGIGSGRSTPIPPPPAPGNFGLEINIIYPLPTSFLTSQDLHHESNSTGIGSGRSTPIPPPSAPGNVGLDIDEDTPSSSAKTSTTGHSNGPTAGGQSQEDMFFMQQATEKEVKEASEEAALDAVKMKLGPKLKEWASDPQSGKLRNVRTLLSTMQTVLWDGCTWKAVFLGDLMAPDRVKFHYRKAMLVLHPDKNVNGSIEQRFIAERVFTSVNEAYTTFAAQELK